MSTSVTPACHITSYPLMGPSLAVASTLIMMGSLFMPGAAANEVQVAAANCVAPYLSQAFPMRWHENYLMNPTSNDATWVICPMNLDTEELSVVSVAQVSGGIMSGAGAELPTCFFTVNSAANLEQPPFIDGVRGRYTVSMQVTKLTDYPAWTGVVGFNALDIFKQILNPEFWAASIFCRLPPGYGISQLRITGD